MPALRFPTAIAAPALLAIAAVVLLAGCSARVVLPAASPQPREVVFLDHGRHSSIVLVDGDDVPWRFAYGEWQWYVERDTGAAAGARALLRPTTAALGRSALQPLSQGHDLQPQVGSQIREQIAFTADADRVDALLRELHAVFAEAEIAPAWQAHLQLEVVAHPLPYTLRHNSNHQVAGWLRAVGATVTGNPAVGRWRIVPPEQSASTGREDEPATTVGPDPHDWTQPHGRMTRPTGYARR